MQSNFELKADQDCANKILVAYASQFGSTGEVAEFIARTLCENGAVAETKRIEEVVDLGIYRAVILGSAIQYDKWMPAARNFVIRHQDELEGMPVAFFFTCLTLSRRTEKTEQVAVNYSRRLYDLSMRVKPIDVGGFGGVLDYGKLPRFFRLLSRLLYRVLGVKEGDYRDWTAIRTWTRTVQLKLSE